MAGRGGYRFAYRNGDNRMRAVRLRRPARRPPVVDVCHARRKLRFARRFGGARILCGKAAQHKARHIRRRPLFPARDIRHYGQRFHCHFILPRRHRVLYELRKAQNQFHYIRRKFGRVRRLVRARLGACEQGGCRSIRPSSKFSAAASSAFSFSQYTL